MVKEKAEREQEHMKKRRAKLAPDVEAGGEAGGNPSAARPFSNVRRGGSSGNHSDS